MAFCWLLLPHPKRDTKAEARRRLSWLKRKINNVWQAPIQIAQSVSTFINGMNGFTISGGLINYPENKITYSVNEL